MACALYVSIFLTAAFFCVGRVSSDSEGASYAIGFMNITTDTSESGFIQVMIVAFNETIARVQARPGAGYDNFTQVATQAGHFFNATLNYNQLTVTSDTDANSQIVNNHGLLVSTNSDCKVYGVKSDRGTTDGFLALPLTTESTQFFVAAWPCVYRDFFGGFQVVAAHNDTCVEVYSVVDGEYRLQYSAYMYQFQLLTYTSELYNATGRQLVQEYDVTGMFVNSSKPIAVYGGHSCAFVPTPNVMFCDHIVEQIPPVSELGTTHVVPPIVGRWNDFAGYVVRVVASENSTGVVWKSPSGSTDGNTTLLMGGFAEIMTDKASDPLLVTCSKPCLVALYNTGRYAPSGNIQTGTLPTDPFMLLVIPDIRYDVATGFAPASFCDNLNRRVNFDNTLVVIVRSEFKDDILLDGQRLTTWNAYWGYSIASMPVSHDQHLIQVVSGSAATFAAYIYGHSILDTSSSAYGFTVTFKVGGTLVTQNWEKSKAALVELQANSSSVTCKQEPVYSGSAVSTYTSSTINPAVIRHYIPLYAEPVTMSISSMSAFCRERYKSVLSAQLLNVSRSVNYQLCTKSLCSYMSGTPGGGASIGASSSSFGTREMYVAVNTSAVSSAVTLNHDATTGVVTSVHVSVPYVGVIHTTAETYAKCRAALRAYFRPFINWPLGVDLVPDLSSEGCGRMTFDQTTFTAGNTVCQIG